MRSTFQPVYAGNHLNQANTSITEQGNYASNLHNYTRSPQPRPANHFNSNQTANIGSVAAQKNSQASQSTLDANQVGTNNARKITGSIKHLQDKLETVQTLMKQNKTPANQKTAPQYKRQYHKVSHDTNTKAPIDIHNLKRQQSQPDLRTSCPNIFRKFQSGNSLRNTTHVNNLTKFGAIMAQIKKHDEQQSQKNMMKKNNGSKFCQPPSNPGHNLNASVGHSLHTAVKNTEREHSYTPSTPLDKDKVSFKSLNDVWNNKMKNNQANGNSNTMSPTKRSSAHKKTIINGFQISKVLGKGKFGEVTLARHVETNFAVALKKIIKAKIVQYKMTEQFAREIRLHSALDHPNIVKFYGFFQDAENIYLILQYINGGTLFDYLGEKDMLNPKQAAQYLRDTIQAVNYMHERSIAHRDIKPENIVLTSEKVAKLCDFGWSALVQSSRTTYCGTFDYAPPQILQRKNYDTAVDIWCLGVLTYEMLTGRVPFEGEKRKQIMQKIISVDKNKINYSVEIPDDAKNFIEILVQKNPESRPKCKDLLKHPFFINNLKSNSTPKK